MTWPEPVVNGAEGRGQTGPHGRRPAGRPGQTRTDRTGAAQEYEATRLAYELGRAVRELREQHGWSQTQLAQAATMTQSAVARFEAGGTIPTLPVLERLAHALGVGLAVHFTPNAPAA